MGFLFKSKTKTTKSPFESNPWEPQQDFLLKGFEGASSALDNAMGQGDAVADLTPEQLQAMGVMTQNGLGAAQDVSSAAIQAGLGGINNVSQMAGNSGTIFDFANQDRTQSVIDNGAAFADNPHLQGQIDAALGDVRKAFDRDVAGINNVASATGNINSTRAGALEARALDDAMDRGAAISSGMRGAAYESGMNRAAGMDAARVQQMLAANGQLGQSGALSLDFANQGLQTGQTGASAAFGAGGIQQAQNQAEIDAARTGEMDLLQRYMALVGGNYGSKGYQTAVSEQPSIAQTLAGAAATYVGAGGTFCWVAREVYGSDDPRWQLFRIWMLVESPDWFFRLYEKHGEWFSGVVRRHPWMKRILRPLMDKAIS